MNPKEVVPLLQLLVSTPSVNPDGDPGVVTSGEGPIAAVVADILKSIGAEVIVEDVLPDRPNVIARFPTNGSGKKRIILGPHLDTVSVGSMTIDPFGAELRDGKIWGRGASDTKGTMAAMIAALAQLGPERIADLNVEVTFVGFAGEESGQPGSKHFAQHHPDYDFALIGEPTGNDIVYRHKGAVWAFIETSGIAAHGSTPERGENAITKMVPVLQALDGPFREKLAEYKDDVLGASTINIGTIKGGERSNIVPDKCRVSLDIRSTPSLAEYGVIRLLSEFLVENCTESGANLVPALESDPLNTNPDHDCIRAMQSIGPKLTGATWFCDAAILANVGIPSVAAGPGDIAQAHTDDEWIKVSDLEDGVRFYKSFLEAM